MVSVLNTATSNFNAMVLELKIANKFQDKNDLKAVLQIGHTAIWKLANSFTDLESGIHSRIQTINDCKEYLAKS
jgi:hypothetical protein